jgi:4-hydroxy-tetrahydrodipicolinate reductase
MNLSILGASGRIGQLLVKQLLANPEDQLLGCFVSSHSPYLGQAVPGSKLKYEMFEASSERKTDVIIDFSTPTGTMQILEGLSARTKALIIGTTGFTIDQTHRIKEASQHVPIMVSVNFAASFGLFVELCKTLQSTYPEAPAELEETYHRDKKANPSGTSLYLAAELESARRLAGSVATNPIPVRIHRRGAVVGEHLFRITLDGEEYKFLFSVNDKEAYANGALKAAHWILGRPAGLYTQADMSRSN